jgi:hypothetical protein
VPYRDQARQREYQRNWWRQRRSDFFRDKTCERCGSAQDLELDHVDPKVKVHHRIWSWSADRRNAELAKCQVLCKDCHLAKTVRESTTKDHGSPAMYQNHGCRCPVCREWKRLSDSKYRGEVATGKATSLEAKHG